MAGEPLGRKRLLLTAVVGFSVASMLCGIAPTLNALILFRVLQGAFGGALQPTARAIILEIFPREERGKAMSIWGMGIVVAPIMAPVLGGWLTTDYSWRWVFFINLPISIVGFVLVYLYVFDPPYLRRTSKSIDVWSVGMLVVGIGALQVVLDKGEEADWFASHLIVALSVIAVVAMLSFVIWQLKAHDPMVHLRLLKYRTFAVGAFLSLVLFSVLYGSILLLPLFMQEMLQFPAVTAGLWNSPRGLATMALMPLAGFLIGRRWDMRALLFAGILVAAGGVLTFSFLSPAAGPWNFLGPQLLMGAGLAFVFVPYSTITVDSIPNEEMGFATSITSLTRNLGASIGISVAATMFARREQVHQTYLVAHLAATNLNMQGVLSTMRNQFYARGYDLATAKNQALRELYSIVKHQASVLSYMDEFRTMAVLFVLVSPLVWIMRKPLLGRR